MTILAYRDGVLASDSRGCSGDVVTSDRIKKIWRLSDGSLIGLAGGVVDSQVTLSKFQTAVKAKLGLPTLTKKAGCLYVAPSGRVSWWSGSGWESYKLPFYTEGSGWIYAAGCMAAGASAVEAVKLTIKAIPSCGGRVQTLEL